MHLVVPPGGSFREPRQIDLGARVLTIGRSPNADVRVDVPGVDDEHARISELAVIAIGNDCAVGDVPLDAGQRRLLAPGDEIQLGSVVLVVDGEDPSLSGGPDREGPRIRVVEGQNFGDELMLLAENREYVIGRSPKADLVLEDREVSREHLKIVRRGASVFIYDQASTRGSWLGRQSVYQGSKMEWQRPQMLKVGATVLALDLPLSMRGGAPAPTPSAPMAPQPRSRSSAPLPPPTTDGPTPNVVAYHYKAKEAPAGRAAGAVGRESGAPARRSGTDPGKDRGGWKKSGARVGRVGGVFLLAIAGLAIAAVLLAVFSLME